MAIVTAVKGVSWSLKKNASLFVVQREVGLDLIVQK
jgi:hypothetical protein